VAFQLAIDHQDLVRSLILVNTAPGLPQDKFRDRLRVAWALFLRRMIVRLFGMRTLGRFLGRKLVPRSSQRALRRRFIERWGENRRDAYLASLAAVTSWNVEHRLGSITCPVCVISGEHDFIPLAERARLPGLCCAVRAHPKGAGTKRALQAHSYPTFGALPLRAGTLSSKEIFLSPVDDVIVPN